MTKLDFVWFLVAGCLGAFGSYENGGSPRGYGRSLAWAVVALFGLLGVVGVIA